MSPKAIFTQLSNQVRHHRISDIVTEVQIHNVSPANFDAFLILHGESPNLKGIKLEYDSRSLRIIMYPPPAAYHECTPVFLQSVLIGLRNTPFDTPERQRSLGIRAIGYRSRDGSYMVPDAAVAVMPRGGSPRLWPTIVVEVANSQSYESVLAKVTRWFRKSHGMVEVALLLKFTAKEPLVDPACFLEVWRYGVVPEVETGSVAVDSASGSSSDGGHEQEVNDLAEDLHHEDIGNRRLSARKAELELDFHEAESDSHHADLSDSSLSTVEDEADLDTLPVDSLSNDADHSDSSLTTLEDETEPDVLLPLPAASPPSEPASEITSSSLEDVETDPDSPADPSTDSSDSTAGSNSAYQPSARPHQRHIYLSRTRQTVLPVSDPADPESRYLTLRYSDFFGSENVPHGRDAAEPVVLDLDELREEIRGLMQLTAMQEEGVKRYAADGNGRGSKRVKR